MDTSFPLIVENSNRLANFWHQGHKWPDTELDYFTHCTAVAYCLIHHQFENKVIAAGLCHDLLTYTDCPKQELYQVGGYEVMDIIMPLMPDKNENQTWREEQELYIESVRLGSWESKAVCVADRIHHLTLLLEVLQVSTLDYFDGYIVGPEEKLWFEDQVCLMLQENWSHPLIDEYDVLVDQLANQLEEMDKVGNNDQGYHHIPGEKQFDEPEIVDEEFKTHIPETTPITPAFITPNQEVKEIKVKEENQGLYLNQEEYEKLLPKAISIGIKEEAITNDLLQKHLNINYFTAFRVLKEMKRLHIISRADSFNPRPVDIAKAKEYLAALSSSEF